MTSQPSKQLKVPALEVAGEILRRGEERTAVVLHPQGVAAPTLHLRFALTLMGTEKPIFPALVLDDWGNEIRHLPLYNWIRREGTLFPRAEIFGYDEGWEETQCFVRELELYARYPCFIYPGSETPQSMGERVQVMVLLDDRVPTGRPLRLESAAEIKQLPAYSYIRPPLSRAHVTWWRVNPQDTASLPF